MKSIWILLFCSSALSIAAQPMTTSHVPPSFRQLEKERVMLQNEQESIKQAQESARLQLEEQQAQVQQVQQYEIWLEQQIKQHNSQSNDVPSALEDELATFKKDQAETAQKIQREQSQLEQQTQERFQIEQDLADLKEERLRIKNGEDRPLLEKQQHTIKQKLDQAHSTSQAEMEKVKQRQQEVLKLLDEQSHLEQQPL